MESETTKQLYAKLKALISDLGKASGDVDLLEEVGRVKGVAEVVGILSAQGLLTPEQAKELEEYALEVAEGMELG